MKRGTGVLIAGVAMLGAVIVVVSRSRHPRSIDGPAAPRSAASQLRRPLLYPPLPIGEVGETPPEAPAAPVAAAAPVDEAEAQAAEAARVTTELERLTKAASLSENQRGRAATIIKTVEHARSMIARRPEGAARQEREKQLDEQAHLALLAVVSSEQARLVASYFDAR